MAILIALAVSSSVASAANDVRGYNAFKTVCVDTKGEAEPVRQLAAKLKWQELSAGEIGEIDALRYGAPARTLGAWRGEINGVKVWVRLSAWNGVTLNTRPGQGCGLFAPPGDAAIVKGRMQAELSNNVSTYDGDPFDLFVTKSEGGTLVAYGYSHDALRSFNGGAKSDQFQMNVLREAR